jgi:hypothetical protein
MQAELLAELRAVMRGALSVKSPVTPATPVTDVTGYRPKPLELQALQRLQVRRGSEGKSDLSPVTAPVPAPPEADESAIEERAGLAADRVSHAYLDAWARLNHQRPFGVSEFEWRLALDDGGQFLDAWGAAAATMRWTPGELFDVPRDGRPGGLVWQLKGERVDALGEDRARLADGRTIKRGA